MGRGRGPTMTELFDGIDLTFVRITYSSLLRIDSLVGRERSSLGGG